MQGRNLEYVLAPVFRTEVLTVSAACNFGSQDNLEFASELDLPFRRLTAVFNDEFCQNSKLY